MALQQVSPNEDVRLHVQMLLELVFQIFARLSLPSESDEDRFPLQQYQQLVYENYLFDMAKLYDIAAVFGPCN